MKKRLGVDFDDVIADASPMFLGFCNRHYGTNFCKEELVDVEFEKQWNVSRDELRHLWAKFHTAEHDTIPPMPGAKEMMLRLTAIYDLHLITNRPTNLHDVVAQWLGHHFPEVRFDGLHFCSRADNLKVYRTKSSVCKRIGAHILLEDHPENVRQCAHDGIHVYLFDQPWNRGYEFPLLAGGIVRVADWHDKILETLFP